MGYHQPSNWNDIATIYDDNAEHQLRISLEYDELFSISCACKPVDSHGCRKPLAVLAMPNGRVQEIYRQHLRDVGYGG